MSKFRYGLGLSRLQSSLYALSQVEAILQSLYLSASAIPENAAQGVIVGSILGARTGSTFSLVNSAGSRFANERRQHRSRGNRVGLRN